jgi:ubiquinone/menaquinone biosynthesis C-methylase UbiE
MIATKSETPIDISNMAATTELTRVQILFDSMASKYEAAFSDLGEQYTAVEWVLSELKASGVHPAKIVDIGCGPGNPVLSTFANAGHDVLGTDISAGMIEEAKKNVPSAKFLQVDTRDFKPPDESFDAVVLMFSLVVDVTKDDIRECIKNMYRITKPGGVFLFGTVAIEGENVDIVWMGRPVTVSSLSPGEVVEQIKEVGFDVVKSEETKYHPVKAPEVGLCKPEEVWPEPLLWVYARKPKA